MHAASKHGTPSLTSLLKDGGVSCFDRSPGGRPLVSDHTQPCLTSVKLIELARPLGHLTRIDLTLIPMFCCEASLERVLILES